METLKGTTALLTGAAGGIGRKIADALAAEGVDLVLTGRREQALREVAEGIRAHAVRTAVVPADLADFDSLGELVASAEAELGQIDILVNNAGIEAAGPFASTPPDEITSILNVNLTAPLLLTQKVLPGMVERGSGHVVFVASAAGRIPPAYAGPYAASKAGLIAATQSLRAEYLDSPVGFSVVSPGYVAGDGMYQRYVDSGVRASRLLGHTTTDKVARAVVRSIRRESVEVMPTGSPARALVASSLLAPRAVERVADRMGVHEFFRHAAKHAGRLD